MIAAAPPDSDPSRPSPWNFSTAREYLTAYFAWCRSQSRKFSYRALTRAAGLGSPNYIQVYLAGRRNIKRTTAIALARALDLPATEAHHFELLVEFEQATEPSVRTRAYRDLLRHAIRHGKTRTLDAARLKYFEHWYVSVIHAMASLDGFKADATWIAQRIAPSIKPHEAQQALDVLFALQIFAHRDGHFEVCEPALETAPAIRNVWIREYHRAMTRLAERALDIWELDRRTTAALTVTVPHDRLSDVLELVQETRRELFAAILAMQANVERVVGDVMQINLAAFPVTAMTPAGVSKEPSS